MLVVYEQFAVAVGYRATCRKLNLLEEGVAVGILLVVLAHYLQGEEPYQINRDDDQCRSADYVFSFFESVVFLHLIFPLLVSPYIFKYDDENDGKHRAADDVGYPLQPVEEVE